jgi:hypothetical protein
VAAAPGARDRERAERVDRDERRERDRGEKREWVRDRNTGGGGGF